LDAAVAAAPGGAAARPVRSRRDAARRHRATGLGIGATGMHADLSRRTFDPGDAYRAVLLQQGRVLLDADVNEQAEITEYHDEVRTSDLVGRSGGRAADPSATGVAALGPFAVVGADGTMP